MITRPTLSALWPDGVDRQAGATALAAHTDAGAESPWPIRALVGFGAWIAAIMLAVFAVLLGLEEEGVAYVVGLIAIGVGIGLRRSAGPGSVFRSQFALSVSLAGHALFLGRVAFDAQSPVAGGMAAVVLGAIVLLLFPDPVHRFLSTVLVVMGLAIAVYDVTHAAWALEMVAVLTAAGFAAAFEFEPEWQASPAADLQLPVGFGLAAAFGILLLPSMTPDLTVSLFGGSVGIAAVLGLVGWRAAMDADAPFSLPPTDARSIAFAGLLVLPVAIAYDAPGLLGGALAMLMSVRRGHPVLFGASVLFFVSFLIAWYANMDLGLMAKSGVLVGTGAALFAARAVAVRRREGIA